jgi:hypothetical protein
VHMNRQELLNLLSSANRRARRARRTTGWILVSALGFGVAYYFDPQSGGARRTRLQHSLRRTARTIDSRLPSEVEDPPPVFDPMLRGLRVPESRSGPAGRAEAAAR